MPPIKRPIKRARFCRRCGATMVAMTVEIAASYDPQTGERQATEQRRWDCQNGAAAAMMGYDSAHSSPDVEILR